MSPLVALLVVSFALSLVWAFVQTIPGLRDIQTSIIAIAFYVGAAAIFDLVLGQPRNWSYVLAAAAVFLGMTSANLGERWTTPAPPVAIRNLPR